MPGSAALTVWPSDGVAAAVWATDGDGPLNPQALNRYSYVQNNPLKYTDPTGHYLSFDRNQAGEAWERLTNLRQQMLNGATKDFNWTTVAEDFLSAVMGLTKAAAHASVLLAPLAELLELAAADTDGKHMQVLEYMIEQLEGFNRKYDKLRLDALEQDDLDALKVVKQRRISFWFTEKNLKFGNTQYKLHSYWGGLEDAPRTAASFVIGARYHERKAWGKVVDFVGYYDVDYI
ncbi:MAG: hypothetical protein MI924_03460 [Chloroflexales bacterium]|nr:hypothetical protein [Chloroflexales bacterium]